LPLVAVAIVAELALASMAVDVGTARSQQRVEQTAADSAALAGAVASSYSTSTAVITAAAQADAASNNFTNGVSGVTVTVNVPPLAGSYAGVAGAVEVVVSQPQSIHFGIFGRPTTSVSARAVAQLSTANRNCMIALDSSSSAAITVNGGTITMPKCSIVSDGGFLLNGQGTINAASIGYNASSGITLNNENFTSATPAPSVPATDPCPTVPGCAYLTATPPTSGSCASQTTFNSSSTITVSPGKYCSQVLFEGGGPVVFNPGVYDFQSGFTNNNAPSMTGTGVTFYMQGGSGIVGSNTVVNLSAPTSGNTQGVLLYQPASNNSQFILNGSSGGNWAGMTYLPSAEIIVDGGKVTTSMLLVADDFLFNSNSAVNVPTSAFPGYAGHAVLSE
jgi:hypothetical protein